MKSSTTGLRVSLILAAAAATSACVSDSYGPLGFASKRTTMAQAAAAEPEITGTVPQRNAQRPINTSSLNPPPSHVEIRAMCWREFEGAAADLDTKTALTQACFDRRIGR
jgi:hypothetical protein